MMTKITRAALSADLVEIRDSLAKRLKKLETEANWYGSIYFERKKVWNYQADRKKTNVSDRQVSGVVFRIYNGQTLFEQATDDLTEQGFDVAIESLVKRVKRMKTLGEKIYQPPTWEKRLEENLESEITSQVPDGVAATTPVHFGIRYKKNPASPTVKERFESLRALVDRVIETAPSVGLTKEQVSYVGAREVLSIEESLFIDRESNMSQTLFRVACFLTVMSGSDHVSLREGGLGGREIIHISPEKISALLSDLKGLKSAERLKPGRYRVLFSPSLTGVLAHEAFGHSQEGDTCARGRSRAWDLFKSGEKAGNAHATIVNNPAAYENGEDDYAAWGSYFFDEEGWLAKEHVLIEGGVLRSPMTNLTSSIRLNIPRTANGKRESFANGVYTRQTNTYFSAGNETYDSLMAKIENGFLATDCHGGMEDPKGMGIQVGIAFLREVKNGKLTGKIFKGPSGSEIQMTGYTPDVLNSILGKSKISARSTEEEKFRHPFNEAGGCGKYHKEFVQAGCGGPYLLLDQVMLG